MYVDNITSENMTLTYEGKTMQIKVYEDLLKEKDKKIEELNNIINELENIIDIEMNKMGYAKYDSCLILMKMKIKELKGRENNE